MKQLLRVAWIEFASATLLVGIMAVPVYLFTFLADVVLR